ncbi:hypothetical protein TI03_00995, partial [Achromatium sp. WMS1]
ADHLDVMGPEEEDVMLALLGTTPVKSKLFTAEQSYHEHFIYACEDRKTEFIPLGVAEIDEVPDDVMSKFNYREHKENVALALKVAMSLGLDYNKSITGMLQMTPDKGVMSRSVINVYSKKLIFINGFAANDPESTEMIWNMSIANESDNIQKIMIINCRFDRPDRTRQFAEEVPKWKPANAYLLIGTGTYIFMKIAVKNGISLNKIVNAEGMDLNDIKEEILSLAKKETLLVGVGNIADIGFKISRYFENRSIE